MSFFGVGKDERYSKPFFDLYRKAVPLPVEQILFSPGTFRIAAGEKYRNPGLYS